MMLMYDKRIWTITTTQHSNDCLLIVKYGQIVDVTKEPCLAPFPGLETAQLLLFGTEHLLKRVPSHKETTTVTTTTWLRKYWDYYWYWLNDVCMCMRSRVSLVADLEPSFFDCWVRIFLRPISSKLKNKNQAEMLPSKGIVLVSMATAHLSTLLDIILDNSSRKR